jgi:diguanylate cyclase (GGDEF)-like protein
VYRLLLEIYIIDFGGAIALEELGRYFSGSIWPLLGLMAIIVLFLLRGVVVAGKWRRKQFLSQMDTLADPRRKTSTEIAKAMRAQRAADFWEMLARRFYFGTALTSALGLVLLQFLPLTTTQSLYVKWVLTLITFGATSILLWYWQGWEDDRERVLRKRLRLAYEREQARRGLVVRDESTGLYSHEFFLQELRREVGRFFQRSLPISCLILELERFDDFKSQWGESVAETTLKRIGQAIEQNVRSYDIAARYGPNRFAVALLKCKREDADGVGQRITGNVTHLVLKEMNRRYAEQLEFFWASCTLPSKGTTPDGAMAAAERMLDFKKEERRRQPLSYRLDTKERIS